MAELTIRLDGRRRLYGRAYMIMWRNMEGHIIDIRRAVSCHIDVGDLWLQMANAGLFAEYIMPNDEVTLPSVYSCEMEG
jgi:hypothetical protein